LSWSEVGAWSRRARAKMRDGDGDGEGADGSADMVEASR
jgi:hypothetical protein